MRRFVPFLFFASSFALICAETLLSTHDDQGVFSNNGNVKKYLKEDGSKSLDANEENVLVQDVSSNTMPSPTYHRILSIETNSRWKDRMGSVIQVPYYIDPTYFDADQAVVIEDAIIKLSEAVNVVQFIPRSNQAAYIHIQDNGTGCNSIIGKIGTGKSQELNLRRNSCLNIGTIQHELLHAIGFRHEQARPDRDAYVRINFDNIDEKQKSNFVIAESSQLLGSQYDYGSVMHYSRTAFALDENVDTVIPLDSGATIGQRDGASSWDIAKVHLLYQCISGPRDYSSYASNPCTADCPCWEGIEGCNGDSTACRGGLVCSDNVCVVDTSTGGGGTGTGGGSCTDVPDWIDRDGDGCMW